MTRNGFFTGLDIGTSSIKVLVAELVDGEVNVIGVSNAKSKGVKDGIIVDIEAAATAIKSAISQAEEKAGTYYGSGAGRSNGDGISSVSGEGI